MVNCRREREKRGERSKEKAHTHTLKNDSYDFLLFQKEMDGVVK